jgi:vacuolar-type H+-ATPase subunit E/Vma4
VSLDALLDAIERRARQEVDRVLEEARERAAAIDRESEARLRARRQAALGEREAALRTEIEASLAAARREARSRTMAAREALLDRVFGAVESSLPGAAASETYAAGLPEALEDALACVEPNGATLECAPALVPVVSAALTRVLGHAPEEDGIRVLGSPETATGLRILSAGGDRVVDLTLAGRLERRRPQLAIVAMEALGADEGDSA